MLALQAIRETAAVTIRGIEGGGENQETTIQPQTTNRKSNHRSCNLDRGPGRSNLQSLSPDKNIHLIKFAPEPIVYTSVGA